MPARPCRHRRHRASSRAPGSRVRDFLAAFGLVLVFEGLVYGGFPALARRLASEVLSMPEAVLRAAGLAAIAMGVGVVWLARG